MATTRRGAFAAIGGALASGSGAAARKRPGTAGPCGNGSRKQNACSSDKDCCTGRCSIAAGKRNRDGMGRCRCLKAGKACTSDRNCCNRMTCDAGICSRGGGGCGTCPVGTHCVDDACVPCTVCDSGCTYTDLVGALADASGPAEILLAPGAYTGPHEATRPVTIDRCGSAGTVTIGTSQPNSTIITFQTASSPSTLRNLILTPDAGVAGTTAVSAGDLVFLTLEDVIVDGASTGVRCSGVTGLLTMTRCTVKNTDLDSGVKVIYQAPTGGAIITDCIIEDNTTTNTSVGGGGIAFVGGVTATITGTTIRNNTAAGGNGGGIAMIAFGSSVPDLTLGANTTVTGNSATGNVANFLGYGGGICYKAGFVTGATTANVTGNSAAVACNNIYNFAATTCDIA